MESKENNKIKPTTAYLFEILNEDTTHFFSVVKEQELNLEESIEFERFKEKYFANKESIFQDNLLKVDYLYSYDKDDCEAQTFHSSGLLFKHLPHISGDLLNRIKIEINKAMDLNKILYKYIPIKGTNLNKIDLFSETGMYFTPSFLELVEQNKDFIIYYMEKLCGISKEEHIYVSPHIYRVEKEQKGTCLHNDFNHNVQNNFESVNELEKGGKILYYHLALTDVRHDTNALIVYPRTCHELPTYAYAFKYLTENNINKDIDFLLKAFYLSQKSAQAFPARLYLLNQYYKAKYKEDIQGLKAEVDAGEGVFFNSLCLHSSHVPHQEDIPRISLVIKIKTITKKNAGVTYFDYVSNALSKIFGISYKDFINILYDNKEPNTKNHLEMLIRGNSDKESNITISNMKNFFNKTASFFNEPEYIVSENFLESLK